MMTKIILLMLLQSYQDQLTQAYSKVKESFIFIGGGCGIVIDADGTSLTNYHVIKNLPEKITVIDITGTEYAAHVASVDPFIDLAIIKIDSDKKWIAVKFEDEKSINRGNQIIAIGNPKDTLRYSFNKAAIPSVSHGIISAILSITSRSDAILTDAPLNSGNSGGPLVNLNGKVVGINVKILSGGVLSQGMSLGVSIPSFTIKKLLPYMLKAGVVYHYDIPESCLKNEVIDEKLTIKAVYNTWGLAKDDIILSVNDTLVKTSHQFITAVRSCVYGTEIKAHIARNGKEETVDLKPMKLSSFVFGSIAYTGFKVNRSLEIEQIFESSPASHTELKVRDVVTELDGTAIKSQDDYSSILMQKYPGESLEVTIKRGEKTLKFTIKLSSK